MALPAINFTNTLLANAKDMKRRNKSAILLWMSGGPPTIDIWDLKPGAATGGNFKPIATTGEGQICEHLPKMAQQMKHMTIVRSMSTREADHTRGRYYMHTGYVPNPSIEHPSYGSVVSHELASMTTDLDIPPFVSVGGGSVGPGFLGMTYAPFVVDYNGMVRNTETGVKQDRLNQRMYTLASLEKSFIAQNRGEAAVEHEKVLNKTVSLFSSKQMEAFKFNSEKKETIDRYGNQLRPRLLDGPATGRSGRPLRRSRNERLGLAQWRLHRLRAHAAQHGPGNGRTCRRSAAAWIARRHCHHLDG